LDIGHKREQEHTRSKNYGIGIIWKVPKYLKVWIIIFTIITTYRLSWHTIL